MKIIRHIRKLLPVGIMFSFLPGSAKALSPATISSAAPLYLQNGGAGAPLGKLNVPAQMMASRCVTMVSPIYPQTTGDTPKEATVVVRVVISKSGSVTPMRAVSGPPSLQDEAMNAVRLWRYKPFSRDGEPLDVTTDIRVDFDPARPGGLVVHPNH
jgi:TonB family protein